MAERGTQPPIWVISPSATTSGVSTSVRSPAFAKEQPLLFPPARDLFRVPIAWEKLYLNTNTYYWCVPTYRDSV